MAAIVLDHMAAIVLDHMAAIVLDHMAAIVLRPFSGNFNRYLNALWPRGIMVFFIYY
jgi:hypothetical protein